MSRLTIFFVFALALLAHGLFAQNSVDPRSTKEIASPKKQHFGPQRARSIKSKKKNVKHSAQYEFYKRVELAAKDKQRLLKKLSKPQFSDPAYFGHKKKPKKRPAHKMKFCHECHIRH